MNRIPGKPSTASWNDNLEKIGSKYRMVITSQTKNIMVRAKTFFEDGSKTRSTGIPWSEPKALERVFQLVLEMGYSEKPLQLLGVTQDSSSPTTLDGWTALALLLESDLNREGIQWHGQDYETHMKEIRAFKGAVVASTLQRWVTSAPDHSRARVRRLVTLRRLLTLTDFDIPMKWFADIKKYSKFDSNKAKNDRILPTDAQIENFIDHIENPAWRAVFGFCAAYGLRPHEPFTLIDWPDEDTYIFLNSKKSGERGLTARRPDWVDRWNLRDTSLPEHNPAASGQALGKKTSQQFSRLKHLVTWGVKPSTYDLRHAFAAAHYTEDQFSHLQTREICESMGHSEDVHRTVYKRWIDKAAKKAQLKRRHLGVAA